MIKLSKAQNISILEFYLAYKFNFSCVKYEHSLFLKYLVTPMTY